MARCLNIWPKKFTPMTCQHGAIELRRTLQKNCNFEPKISYYARDLIDGASENNLLT